MVPIHWESFVEGLLEYYRDTWLGERKLSGDLVEDPENLDLKKEMDNFAKQSVQPLIDLIVETPVIGIPCLGLACYQVCGTKKY
jgi:hypothetical protein